MNPQNRPHRRRVMDSTALRSIQNSTSRPSGPYTGVAGTLPSFLASGLDPSVLLQYPEPVRPAMAAADTTQEAYAIGARYAGMTNEQAAAAIGVDRSVPEALAFAWAGATGYDQNAPQGGGYGNESRWG